MGTYSVMFRVQGLVSRVRNSKFRKGLLKQPPLLVMAISQQDASKCPKTSFMTIPQCCLMGF